MNHSPNTLTLKQPITSRSLSAEDVEAINKILSRGPVNLTQPPLEELLQRFAQNREERRRIHIDIAMCAVTDCFAAVKNGEIYAREKAFGRKLADSENTGHYLYRFFRANCRFPAPKATKISTYLEERVREGLSPAELRKRMTKEWKLEDGYHEALRARDQSTADPAEEENDHAGELRRKTTQSSKANTLSSRRGSVSGDDDPPRSSRLGKKPERDDNDFDEPKSLDKKASPLAIELIGTPRSLGSQRKSFGIVHFSVKGKPLKITFMSPKHAKARAEHYLAEQRKAKRRQNKAA